MKVFWSWQSDTPGKSGRHFVRKALEQAIKTLQEEEDIIEPSEREARDQLHLDHDRKDVPGSPDLARTIFDKIDASSVLIADVTPVSTLERKDESGEKYTKRNMNPNVAIELGYALKSLGDNQLLMVLNTHYGARDSLPFDLAHKAGPITYKLAPDADASTYSKELSALERSFRMALKPYLGASEKSRMITKEASTLEQSGLYFSSNEELAQFGSIHDGDRQSYFFSRPSALYLRLIPTKPLQAPIAKPDLLEMLNRSNLFPFSRVHDGLKAPNSYGAIIIQPKSNTSSEILSSTQIFPSGELWGVNQWLLREEDGKQFIPTAALEECLTRTLQRYFEFASASLGLDLPFLIVFGGVHLRQYSMVVKTFGGHEFWPILEESFEKRLLLNAGAQDECNTVVKAQMDAIFHLTGYRRP